MHRRLARRCDRPKAALAARNGSKYEAEIQRLNDLVAQLQHAEQSAQRDAAFLNPIIDHPPISPTVQDGCGRFMLVNSIAAANLEMPADAQFGAAQRCDRIADGRIVGDTAPELRLAGRALGDFADDFDVCAVP